MKKQVKDRIFKLELLLKRETHEPTRKDIQKVIDKLKKEIK